MHRFAEGVRLDLTLIDFSTSNPQNDKIQQSTDLSLSFNSPLNPEPFLFDRLEEHFFLTELNDDANTTFHLP